MSTLQTQDVITSALWPQGDIRDPLGVWGARAPVTGDATGGENKVLFQAQSGINAAYIYTCYEATWALLTGSQVAGSQVQLRLLTNWPDVDPLPGVQGFGTVRMSEPLPSNNNFTAPTGGVAGQLVLPNDRFLLLFDPRPGAGDLVIAEIKYSDNVDAMTTIMELYGYYWDRSVLQAPGGPRHPGAS